MPHTNIAVPAREGMVRPGPQVEREPLAAANGESAYRAAIPAIAAGVRRPLWSVMIPTYNCADFLRETLLSVLAQDPGPEQMHIEVVDDCSTRDDPEAVVREVGAGRVAFYRQPRNVGHVRNFETCLLRSRGHLVHLLHGDDRVREGFYRLMAEPFERHPDIGAAFCRHIHINETGCWTMLPYPEQFEAGVLENWLERIATMQHLQMASVVVRRSVYEHLGGFDRRIECMGEDWEMWVRIAAHYPVWYEPTPLAEYRKHSSSLTGNSVRTGRDAQDLRRVVELNRAHLAGRPDAERLARRARYWCSYIALKMARRAALAGDYATMRVQIREGFRSSPSLRVAVKAGLLIGQAALWKLKHRQRSAT